MRDTKKKDGGTQNPVNLTVLDHVYHVCLWSNNPYEINQRNVQHETRVCPRLRFTHESFSPHCVYLIHTIIMLDELKEELKSPTFTSNL